MCYAFGMKKIKKIPKTRRSKKKYTMADLLAFKIKSKNPQESLVDQIDHIVYGI